MELSDSEVPCSIKGIKVGIIYNLKKEGNHKTQDEQAEYDNIETVYSISRALAKKGHRIILFEADTNLVENLKQTPIDIAFNIAEGIGGRSREGQVPAILEMLGIPHTGSDATALCISLDKALTKRLVSTCNVRTPKFAIISKDTPYSLKGMNYPLIVKPNAEGSSKGISSFAVVKDKKELHTLLERNFSFYGGQMLVEEYIEGREFTVGVIGNGRDRIVFPPMEIIYKKPTQDNFHVYSFPVKQAYNEFVEYKSPADIDDNINNQLIYFTKKVCDTLGCYDFSRVDFRVSAEGRAYFIEINPLPGLAEGYSDYPMLAAFNGVDYDSLVNTILDTALMRYGFSPPKAGE